MNSGRAISQGARIYIAGHRGLVGSAIARTLVLQGFTNIVTATSKELDLRNQSAVATFFDEKKPEYVFLAAAHVGGILANSTYPADFIYDNLQIQTNVIHAAHAAQVKKLLFLGSVCIYPKFAAQPIKESYLLTGALETSNESYAIAKIAGIKLCQAFNNQYGTNFISVMPANLYGPGDNFDLETSHVMPALIRKFHEAKKEKKSSVVIWGTGEPRREFCHVDDVADACVFLMRHYESNEIINIGVGTDISIKDLGELVKQIVGYEGGVTFDTEKPDGTPRRLLDISKIVSLGWSAKVELANGIKGMYDWYLSTENHRGE